MAKYSITDTTLTAIADAIREKAGKSDAMTPAQMAEMIAGLKTGGEFATATCTVAEKTAIDQVTISHDLGRQPVYGVWWVEETTLLSSDAATGSRMMVFGYIDALGMRAAYTKGNASSSNSTSLTYVFSSISQTAINYKLKPDTLGFFSSAYNGYIQAGTTIRGVVW